MIGSYKNIASAATYVLRPGPGVLIGLTINKAVANGVITIYDNTSAAGTKIATITHPGTLLQTQYGLLFNVAFTTGLTIVTGAADDITVSWRPQ